MMISRREMIAGIAGAAWAKAGYAPVLAVQTYVWSQHFARQKKTVAEGLDEIIEGCSRAGYRHIELTSEYLSPALAERTTGLLKKFRFDLPVIYNGGPMHTETAAEQTIAKCIEAAEKAKPCGAKALNINCNPKPKGERKSDDELAVQARAVDRLAQEMKKRGLRLFIHQHAPEMAENAREWRHILKNTDPKAVEFCLDTHWVLRGGQDVMTLLKECGSRLGSLHLRNSKNGVWLEDFSAGDIDYGQVAAYLKEIGFHGWLMVELAYDKETAITRPIVDSLRISREYAESVFGVKA
jgi:sugar phosphate isomerase/epimerase